MKRVPLSLFALLLIFPSLVCAQATLEDPQPGSFQSGIGLIRGWVCNATQITLEIDGQVFQAAYGTTRGDTLSVCGDANNGFGMTVNWNLLGDGQHRVRALANGVAFADVTFTVTTLGLGNFPRGLSGQFSLKDFPSPGRTTFVQWQESVQNFVIRGSNSAGGSGSGGSAPRVLEDPQPGSFQSGIGLIRGWVCNATTIEIEVDGNRFQAAYGTTRGDTQAACGDANNGFGLTVNWNLLGDGQHRVRALADGVAFSDVTFTVTTLGLGSFPRGLSGEFTFNDFPQTGTNTRVRWQESIQNFVIIGRATSPPPSVPDVAGTWIANLAFVRENCNFLDRSDLPGRGQDTFQLTQQGDVLSGEQEGDILSGSVSEGELSVSGEVESNGDFILTTEAVSIAGGACRARAFAECTGNFPAKDIECEFLTRLSGSCPSELNECEIVYRGTIARASNAVSLNGLQTMEATPLIETVTNSVISALRE